MTLLWILAFLLWAALGTWGMVHEFRREEDVTGTMFFISCVLGWMFGWLAWIAMFEDWIEPKLPKRTVIVFRRK
jgi:hypothetical protein